MCPRNIVLGLAVLGSLVTWHGVTAQQPPQRQEQADKALKFEVVSVRLNRDTTARSMINSQPGGRFIVQNFSLRTVILSAYDLRSYQLVDVPAWVQSERYDITALTGRDEFASVVEMRPLIQALLADRFRLQISREQRIMQTYALIRLRADTFGPDIRSVKLTARLQSAVILRMQVPAALGFRCRERSPLRQSICHRWRERWTHSSAHW